MEDRRVDALVEALSKAAGGGDVRAVEQARHVAGWAARISSALPEAPSGQFVYRCAMLAAASPDVFDSIPALARCAPVVRDFQRLVMAHPTQRPRASTASLILVVAEELDALMYRSDRSRRMAPASALRFMYRHADDRTRPIVGAALESLGK